MSRTTSRRPLPAPPPPPSRRTAVIAVSTLLGVGAILAIALSLRVNPEERRKYWEGKADEVRAIVEIVQKDERATALLAEQGFLEEHAVGHKKLAREAEKWRELATVERRARREVPPFLAKVKALKEPPDGVLYEALASEHRSLKERFADTSFGPALAGLDIPPPPPPPPDWELAFMKLKREGTLDVEAGNSRVAFEKIAEFERIYTDKEQALRKAGEHRADMLRREEGFISRLLAEADRIPRAEGRRKVEAAAPNLAHAERLTEWLRTHP